MEDLSIKNILAMTQPDYENQIAELRAENERLREALKNIIDSESWIFSGDDLKDIAKEALR